MATEKKNGERKSWNEAVWSPDGLNWESVFADCAPLFLHATKKDHTPHAEKLEVMNEIRGHTQSPSPQCLFMIDQSNIYAFSAN